ncbi:MAG: STAS domain-containing protein [Clostridiales bacterium]|nr:STAS domain-containing protein [Clostridiales bacterium]
MLIFDNKCHAFTTTYKFRFYINVTLFLYLGGQMQIKNRIYENTLYVILSGELDEHSAYQTRVNLDEIFTKPNFNQVIIDLSELEFMDSTGIGVLVGRYKKLKDKNIPIFICNPSSHAERIFKMTGLYEIMPKIS